MQLTKLNFGSAFRCLSYPDEALSCSVNNKVLASLACLFLVITEAQSFQSDEP